MSLITRCAHCHTVFRITAEQLQAHGGQVRCGRCMQVFNGLSALSPDAAMGMTPVIAVPQAIPAPADETVRTAAEHAIPEMSQPPAPFPEPDLVAQAASAEPEPLEDILPDEPPLIEPAIPARIEPVTGTDAAAEAAPAADDNPFLNEEARDPLPPPSTPRRLLAAAACLVLLTGLAIQAIYFYRGEIAARHVLAREWLNAACAELGCTVEPPQRPKSLLIEASDLQSIDPARPERIQLTATLRNHAGYVVAYPALDLVLTNVYDHTLARRIFLPSEYLGSGRNLREGIAANAELTVRIGLETGNLGAAGFRLAVLPAPSP